MEQRKYGIVISWNCEWEWLRYTEHMPESIEKEAEHEDCCLYQTGPGA